MKAALIVPVREAIDAVDPHRRSLDESSVLGVPPHVTVLFPFSLPSELDRADVARLAEAVLSVPVFSARFSATRWFGDDVLWLAPEDDSGFRALTEAIAIAFPDLPPYGGIYEDVVPHLTVGTAPPGTSEQLRAAERALSQRLPIETDVDAVDYGVLSETRGSWVVQRRLPLG